jgi:hypothetical protein
LRHLEGNGIADACDADIKQQMKDKHPPAANGVAWPELPPEWLQTVQIDLSDLPSVLHKADPKTGVGTRGVRPSHLNAVYQGKFCDPEAIAATSRRFSAASAGPSRWNSFQIFTLASVMKTESSATPGAKGAASNVSCMTAAEP